ncbi:MAG: hypothetical protein RR426_10225, partial [Oscillospiraceae bacterium]
QEVNGSIPFISTIGKPKKLVLMKIKTSFFIFRPADRRRSRQTQKKVGGLERGRKRRRWRGKETALERKNLDPHLASDARPVED